MNFETHYKRQMEFYFQFRPAHFHNQVQILDSALSLKSDGPIFRMTFRMTFWVTFRMKFGMTFRMTLTMAFKTWGFSGYSRMTLKGILWCTSRGL